ncbi:MAG: serine hydrolase domain-containing protein [Minwuia sp.]|uniref:serine hydrolase domain-containing protein n=1 Tax=Minwuia sp. TaxID=2493630 RepID=UPI003A8AE0F2
MEKTNNGADLGFDPERLERLNAWMARYVEGGRLPGAVTLIARHGELAFCDWTGRRDVARDKPWEGDTIVRAYSMSKPITSVALMMLYEHGLFHLDDPVARFLPELSDLKVLRPGATSISDVEDCRETMTVRHLLTHMSGLTYGFQGGVLGEAYEERKLAFGPKGESLEAGVKQLADLPLNFQPGSRWNYGVSTDVVGRLVEVISGQDLKSYLDEKILGPLGMEDTFFGIPDAKLDRYAELYTPDETTPLKLVDTAEKSVYREAGVKTWSGGGGLQSTIGDYWKFAEMLRRGGETADGKRLLGPRTVEFMASNHLDGDLAANGQPVFSEVSYAGIGFGLGFAVMLNPAKSETMGSPGDFGWGGMASTVFWVDPVEDMVVIFMTQLMPSSFYPIRKELRALVHQALVD